MSAPPTPLRLRWALAALCVTVTTSYGVLFYAFPVLATSISADTGWTMPQLTAAFSAGQLVTAISGPLVGRWLDRSGPRPVMTAGSLLAVPAVACMASAQGPIWFLLSWIPVGAACAMLFYPPAFAALTRWYGKQRVRALTTLTLVAGFASTIFAPLTAALEAQLGWRSTFLVLAAVLAVVTIPPHLALLTPAWPRATGLKDVTADATVGAIVRGRAFLALAGSFTLCAFAIYGMVVHMVPLLTTRGIDAQAASWALGIGGVGQVLGRFAYPPLSRRTGTVPRTALIVGSCAAATALLALLPAHLVLLLGAAFLAGMARGIFTLLEATAISDRWGASNYGTLNGILHTPLLGAIALAPWTGSVLAVSLGGYQQLFVLLAAIGTLATALTLLTRPRAG